MLSILRGDSAAGFMVMIAIVCSSFVGISRASTGRSWLNPLGLKDVPCVQVGNLLASRLVRWTFFTIALTHSRVQFFVNFYDFRAGWQF